MPYFNFVISSTSALSKSLNSSLCVCFIRIVFAGIAALVFSPFTNPFFSFPLAPNNFSDSCFNFANPSTLLFGVFFSPSSFGFANSGSKEISFSMNWLDTFNGKMLSSSNAFPAEMQQFGF